MNKTLLENHRELTFYMVDGNLCSWPNVKRKNRCNYSILYVIIENIRNYYVSKLLHVQNLPYDWQ